MIFETNRLIEMLQNGEYDVAYSLMNEMMDAAEQTFIEQLTVRSATDLVALAVLYCQFASKEKKPWKSLRALGRIGAATRYLDQYMSDRAMLSSTLHTIALAYAYANCWKEAAVFEQKSLFEPNEMKDTDEFGDRFYHCVFWYSMADSSAPDELKSLADQVLGKLKAAELFSQACDDADHSIVTDPIENSDDYRAIRYELEREVDLALSKSSDSNKPYCLRYWDEKKRILSDRFNLSWKSPEELNPNIRFQ